MERKQLYWEDVETGQKIPGFSLKINATRIVLQVSGSQDYYPVHHDKDFAKSTGLEDVFVHTRFLQTALGRVISDWTGPEGWLSKFKMKMQKMIVPGDLMTCQGKVTAKYIKDGTHYVECDVWAENQREVATTAQTVITLPSKGTKN